MQIEWSEGEVLKFAGVVKAVERDSTQTCKDDLLDEMSLGEDWKKRVGRNRDTHRRDALKRVENAVYGRVISCSGGQDRWRTELELCRCESFDDGHRSAAVRTAPQRVRGRSGRRCRFVYRWSGVESGTAPWQQGGASSVGEEAEVADADEAFGEQVQEEAAQELIQ